MGDLERDTRLRPSASGAGHYSVDLCEDWRIWGPNGGYLAVIALRAVGLEAELTRPASFHAHFLSVARFEEVDVSVVPVRRGRRSESFQVAIHQRGKPILAGLVRTAAEAPGLEHDFAVMPEVPPAEDLSNVETLRTRFGQKDDSGHAFWDNIEQRPIDPERMRGAALLRPRALALIDGPRGPVGPGTEAPDTRESKSLRSGVQERKRTFVESSQRSVRVRLAGTSASS